MPITWQVSNLLMLSRDSQFICWLLLMCDKVCIIRNELR
jgi:hypothetical protein